VDRSLSALSPSGWNEVPMRRCALVLLVMSSACASTRVVQLPLSEADREELGGELQWAPWPTVYWRDEQGLDHATRGAQQLSLLPDAVSFMESVPPPRPSVESYASREVPLEALYEVDYQPKRTQEVSLVAGAVIGGIAGTLGGAYLGSRFQPGHSCWDERSTCAVGAYLGVLVGTVVGALAGLVAAPRTYIVFR
jgi:hypothetical protein